MSQELSKQDAEKLLGQVREETQSQALQELFQKMSEKCFSRCVKAPGSSLSSKEQTCLANCMDRYLDVMQAVSDSMTRSE